MAANETTLHFSELVQTVGDFTVEGTQSLLTALSDTAASTAIVIQPQQTPTFKFKLSANEIAQIPDGLVDGVSLAIGVDYDEAYTVIVIGNQTVTANQNQWIYMRTQLESTVLAGTGPTTRGDSRGPIVTGIDLDDLKFGVVTVQVDTNNMIKPLRLRSLSLVVTSNQRPVITPGGTIEAGDQPTIYFGFSDPEGRDLEAFRMLLFTEEQAGKPGFNPNTATPVQTSGTVYSRTPSHIFETPLEINVAYRAYVQASEVGSNGRVTSITQAGPYVPVLVSAEPGPIPRVLAAHAPNPGRVELQVDADINLLSFSDSRLASEAQLIGQGSTGSLATQLPRSASLSGTRRIISLATFSYLNLGVVSPVEVTPDAFYVGTMRASSIDDSLVAASLVLTFHRADGSQVAKFDGPLFQVGGLARGEVTLFVQASAPSGATTVRMGIRSPSDTAKLISLSSARIVERLELNLVANPLLDHGTASALDYWKTWSTIGNVSVVSRRFSEKPLLAGLRSTVVAITNSQAATGIAQLMDLPPGQSFAFAAVVQCNKAATIVLQHPQLPRPIGVGVSANVPTLFGAVLTTGSPPASPTRNELVLHTTTPNCEITVGLVEVFPASPGTDFSSFQLLDDWTPGQGDAKNAPYYRVERSIDEGETWLPVYGAAGLDARARLQNYQRGNRETLVWNDYEVPPDDTAVLYRARSVRVSNDYVPVRVPSVPSALTLAAGEGSADGGSFLISLTDPSRQLALDLVPGIEDSREKNSSTKVPIEGLPTVIYGGATGWDGSYPIELYGREEHDTLVALDAEQSTLLLRKFDEPGRFVAMPDKLTLNQDHGDHWTATLRFVETEPPIEEE